MRSAINRVPRGVEREYGAAHHFHGEDFDPCYCRAGTDLAFAHYMQANGLALSEVRRTLHRQEDENVREGE